MPKSNEPTHCLLLSVYISFICLFTLLLHGVLIDQTHFIALLVHAQGYPNTPMARFHHYVVYRGRRPGIYDSWEECKPIVLGYPNAQFKGFTTLEDATDSFNRFVETVQTDRIVETERVTDSNVPRQNPINQDVVILKRARCLLWTALCIFCFAFLLFALVLYAAFSMSH